MMVGNTSVILLLVMVSPITVDLVCGNLATTGNNCNVGGFTDLFIGILTTIIGFKLLVF